MNKKNHVALWAIFSGVFATLTVASVVGSYFANNYGSAAINMALNTPNFITVDDPNAEKKDFFTTSYEFKRNGESLYAEDTKAIENAEKEGAVLLWNKKETLPLKGNEKVSLLSHNSVDLVECGSGSGYVVTYDYKAKKQVKTTLKDALESRGFAVNPTLWDFYNSGDGSSFRRTNPEGKCNQWQQWMINEVPYSKIPSSVKDSFTSFGDVALITLSRSGGEYSDLHYNYTASTDSIGNNDAGKAESKSADGGYLGLSDEEEELFAQVSALKKQGVFSKVILLLNTGNPLQMQDIEKYYSSLDSCLWIGQPGSTGINAVADLLRGKDNEGNSISPSGRLPDTWAYNLNSAPATVNDGNYTYQNTDLLSSKLKNNISFFDKYMVYQEDVYVGYRYYETRFFDSQNGDKGASSTTGAYHSKSNWKYDEEVAFPFGFGLSYSKFSYGNYDVKEKDDSYEVACEVKNIGSVPSKQVIQAYLSKPYTEYDQENEIEKPAIELVGYTKTKELQPGESQEVTITIPKEEFKNFDSNGRGTYIVEGGDYYLTLATDSHEATNNVLEAKGFAREDGKVLGDEEKPQGIDFTYKITKERDYKTYAHSTETGAKVECRLDDGDINKYSHAGENKITYLSRSDWEGTYPKAAPQLSLNDEMAADLDYDIVPDDEDEKIPNYSTFASGSTTGNPDTKKGDVVAYQFMDAPLYPENYPDRDEVYEDGLKYSEHWERMWNQLLDQMSFDEQANMIVNSFHWIHGANSIALPESRQENGPVGITKRQEAFFSLPNDDTIAGDNGTGWTWVAYPCASILGASYNIEVAKDIGTHKSEDMLYLGYNGIYGPGCNLHRSPFGGRAFEYPSEDPILTGYTEAYETLGIESKGCLAYVKHFALNDFETNRVNCGVWSTEQATREIYLKAFEIVFRVGKASATMNSYTRIGTKWNGACEAMMKDILRTEWGYDGIVISDWDTDGSGMSKIDGVLAGTNSFDGNRTKEELIKYKDNAKVCQAMRESCKIIIYNVVRTNAMNGVTLSSMVVPVTPWWQTALVVIQFSFGSLTLVSLVFLVINIIKKRKNKKEA